MKTIKILTLGALAASMSFAADAPSVTPVDQCRLALDNAKTNLPSNAYAAKLTLAEGYGTLNAFLFFSFFILNFLSSFFSCVSVI